jgi:hypothetical protein
MLWPERDCNPFFHLMESMWMLAGRNDVAFVARYASRMQTFSDDGKTLRGAYGYCWRYRFGYDQLELIAHRLRKDPTNRRQVLTMWDPEVRHGDLQNQSSKDLPCNTHIYFVIDHSGKLDMTVCNRSNDIVWGCMGANAVHMSYLMEYMAAKIQCQIGKYFQFTNNLHGYIETLENVQQLVLRQGEVSLYQTGVITPYWINEVGNEFMHDLENLTRELHGRPFGSPFFRDVVAPMDALHACHKARGPNAALRSGLLEQVVASDWRTAAREWLERRRIKQQKAQDDGVKYE